MTLVSPDRSRFVRWAASLDRETCNIGLFLASMFGGGALILLFVLEQLDTLPDDRGVDQPWELVNGWWWIPVPFILWASWCGLLILIQRRLSFDVGFGTRRALMDISELYDSLPRDRRVAARGLVTTAFQMAQDPRIPASRIEQRLKKLKVYADEVEASRLGTEFSDSDLKLIDSEINVLRETRKAMKELGG